MSMWNHYSKPSDDPEDEIVQVQGFRIRLGRGKPVILTDDPYDLDRPTAAHPDTSTRSDGSSST